MRIYYWSKQLKWVRKLFLSNLRLRKRSDEILASSRSSLNKLLITNWSSGNTCRPPHLSYCLASSHETASSQTAVPTLFPLNLFNVPLLEWAGSLTPTHGKTLQQTVTTSSGVTQEHVPCVVYDAGRAERLFGCTSLRYRRHSHFISGRFPQTFIY